MASSQLIWELTKSNASYLKSGNGMTFSKDPMNLCSRNCFTYSGAANKQALNVVKENNKILLLTKAKQQNKPRELIQKTQFKDGKRRTLNGIRNCIRHNTSRKQLEMMALRKASALMRSTSTKDTKN